MSPVLLTVRFGSSRLPGKCLLPFSNNLNQPESVLAHVINRAKSENRRVIVCTGESASNDAIIESCIDYEIEYFRGNEKNKIARWGACFEKFNLSWAHFVDVDDPFFCNSELESSIETFHSTGYAVISTEKSKSGNASVGITLSADHVSRMNSKVGHLASFEMVEDLISELFKAETIQIASLDPIPEGTRLTLDYFEDYLALSLIKLGLSTSATRQEVYNFILQNPWVIEINASRNEEWRARQIEILRSQESSN